MKKILVLYVAHFINDFSLSQYYKLKNELPDGYDIVWWLDDSCKSEIPNIIEGIKFIKFPHDSIIINNEEYKWLINPTKYMEYLFEHDNNFASYDYYWICEYDVYYNGNWKNFFTTCDQYNEDLIGANMWYYDKQYMIEHMNESFVPKEIYETYDKVIKSTISLYRISNKGMKTIVEHNKDNIKKYLYEVYIPTILYKNGLSLLGLNCERFWHDEIQNRYDDVKFIDCLREDFYFDSLFTKKSQMNKHNKLFTRFKEE